MKPDNIESYSKDQLNRLLHRRNASLKSLRAKNLKQHAFTISLILMYLSAIYGSSVFLIARFRTEDPSLMLLLIAIPMWIYFWSLIECSTMFEKKINTEINILKDGIKAIDCSITAKTPPSD